MAAYRAGIRTVILPEENRADLSEIDPVVRDSLEFIPVQTVDRVWEIALANDGYLKQDKAEDFSSPLAEPKRGAQPAAMTN